VSNGIVAAQQTTSAAGPNVLVYHDDRGIRGPELLAADFSILVASDCKNEVTGIVTLSLVIDSSGKSRNIAILDPFADDLDRMAIGIAKVDRFTPGIRDNVPVNVAREIEITLSICTARIVDKDGTSSDRLRLESAPIQKLLPGTKGPPSMATLTSDPRLDAPDSPKPFPLAEGIAAPVPTHTSEPDIPQDERRAKFQGACLISVIVDEKGFPHHVRVVRGLNKELNQKAVEAVSNYRFKPGMKGKQPVAVMMSIEVTFKLY
jgi:TonB family protein